MLWFNGGAMNPKKIAWIFIVFGLSAILLGGLFYYFSIKKSLYTHAHRLAVTTLDSLAFEVNQEMGHLRTAVDLVSVSPDALSVLTQKEDDHSDLSQQERADRFVDTLSKALVPSVVFIMDQKGTVVATSNRQQEDSFLGNNYHFRPYFQEALKGTSSVYLAFGVTSKRKGFYFASPIRSGDAIVGVLVVKQSLDLIDKKLQEFGTSGTICFVSPDGLVFTSTEKTWELKTMGPLDPQAEKILSQTRQFGPGPFEKVPITKAENKDPYLPHSFVYLTSDGRPFTRHEQVVYEIPGWKLIFFHDIQETHQQTIRPFVSGALWTLAPGMLFVTLLTLFLFINLMNALNKEAALLNELKTKVAEIKTLRGILPICCYCKKIRTDEDAWHHMEVYISEHSSAEFSHGVCPECMESFKDDLGLEESDFDS